MITVDPYTTYDYVEAVEILKRKIDKQADEIERLREALKKIADATHSDWFSMKEAARAALKGDE